MLSMRVPSWVMAALVLCRHRTAERHELSMTNNARAGNRRYFASSPFKPPPAPPAPEQYELDDLVTHDKYGLGRVILVEGTEAVVVDFSPRKIRIETPFTRLSKL
jgi:hypothetical protein